ncbi:UNVERIFIED_CONTAM: hypothetical protein Sradi_0017900 [Sesamum radiatum]|uniref:Uncharacterized protein n=1 Tax=Sesamum radiatum TaxID=300843 RepID=A0AAW2WKM0_SESRA
MGTSVSEILEGSPNTPPRTKVSNCSAPGGTKSKKDSKSKRSGSKLPSPYDPARARSSSTDDRGGLSTSGIKGYLHSTSHNTHYRRNLLTTFTEVTE